MRHNTYRNAALGIIIVGIPAIWVYTAITGNPWWHGLISWLIISAACLIAIRATTKRKSS